MHLHFIGPLRLRSLPGVTIFRTYRWEGPREHHLGFSTIIVVTAGVEARVGELDVATVVGSEGVVVRDGAPGVAAVVGWAGVEERDGALGVAAGVMSAGVGA